MKKYNIFYWAEVNDSKDWFDIVVEDTSLENALENFKKKNPFAKVESVQLVMKDKFVIRREVLRNVLENVFVTALEGSSNYWYYLPKESIKRIREAVPKEEDPYLATAMLKAVLDHNVSVPIYDAEDIYEEIGRISRETIHQRLQDLHNNKGLSWALEVEINECGDAESSDVVFQYISMGEHVYG